MRTLITGTVISMDLATGDLDPVTFCSRTT
jgi:hypothetical protein